jgi:hypothetical protein
VFGILHIRIQGQNDGKVRRPPAAPSVPPNESWDPVARPFTRSVRRHDTEMHCKPPASHSRRPREGDVLRVTQKRTKGLPVAAPVGRG